MKENLHTYLHTQDKLADLRDAFNAYLRETYPNVSQSTQSRHWTRFLVYLKKDKK